jgi:predicted TIM-barrel fold metal-dependent hydrolase
VVIDANVYWFPEELFADESLARRFLADVPRGYDTNGFMTTSGNTRQIVIEKPKGFPGVNYVQNDYILQTQLRDMDGAGVDRAVLKVPCCHEWMGLDMCRLFNDGMADFAKRSGGRMTALAVIPPWGAPDSFIELDRCKNALGMKGIQLCAHYGNLYLDDKAFAPLMEKLNAHGMTAYVHHTPVPTAYGALYVYNNLRRTYGRCADQTTAVARELFSGLFERYPNVRVVHSMLGGGFFAYLNMMLPSPPKEAEGAVRFDPEREKLRAVVQKNIFFEMSHAQPWGKAQLECAVKTLGADHILFGSSYPVRKEWMTEGPQFVRDLDISGEEKDLILAGNARRLYAL